MNIKGKRIISIVLTLVFLISFISLPSENVFAAEENVLQIIHVNDVHGRIEENNNYGAGEIGLAKIQARIKELKAENPNTLLFDAGDAIHGTIPINLTEGKSMIELMNTMEFDAMVPGNHDFNYGYKRLLELKEMANFPILAENVVYESDNTLLFDSYIVKTMENGLKVGIFGLATPETKYKSHPKNTEGVVFTDAVEKSKEAVQALQNQNVDVIIALSHLGSNPKAEMNSIKVAEAVPQIDVIIDGHSHTKLEEGKIVNGVLIAQTEAQTKNLGIVNIKFNNSEVKEKTARLEGYDKLSALAPNKEISTKIEKIKAENDKITSEVVGKTAVALDGERENVRTGETNLGNLITDAMRESTNADIAFTNGGGIRSSIDKGDITLEEILKAFPFTNTLAVIEVTGQELLNALEHGVDTYPDTAGHFAHVSGMTYKFNPDNEVGSRIVNVTVNDEELDLNKTYKLVTNDFMASGGDGYDMFKGKPFIAEGGLLSDVLLDYLDGKGEINIGIEGRITVGEEIVEPEPKPEPEPEPTPEPEPEPEPTPEPTEPHEPSDPSDDGSDTGNDEGNTQEDSKDKTEKEESEKLKQTGTNINYLIPSGMIIVLIGAFVLLRNKLINNK